MTELLRILDTRFTGGSQPLYLGPCTLTVYSMRFIGIPPRGSVRTALDDDDEEEEEVVALEFGWRSVFIHCRYKQQTRL